MAYAIGHIVYGIDLQTSQWGAPDEWEKFRDLITELSEMDVEEPIVSVHYNGGGDEPVYIGVDLGSIDECNTVDGEKLTQMLVVTDEHKEAFKKKLGLLYGEPAFFDFYAKLMNTPAKVFITWGTS